jgi:integrase
MVFRRRGRPTWYWQAKVRQGFRQMSAGTPDKRLADRIEAMWSDLAERHRAWDVLERVGPEFSVGQLYDLWLASDRRIEELRRRLNDVDLEPMVEPFLAAHAKRVKPDTLAHIRFHLRSLIPEGTPAPRSRFTVGYLTTALADYAGSPGTTRKVHSDWSVFFAYCTDELGHFERNPMERVKRPPARKPVVAFYELDTVERIVGAQPTAERRALFALLYGTGMEISVALRLTAADVWRSTQEMRAAGTKTHTRDRMARVASWAWPHLSRHIQAMLDVAPLFPGIPSRHTASDWHAETVKALKLSPALPMKNARHHWAVRALRAGTPIAVVQHQLGHASPTLTLTTYGQFIPGAADRDKWEQAATDYESERRSAKGSAAAPVSFDAESSAPTKSEKRHGLA